MASSEELRVAEMMMLGQTKFRATKQLMAEGLSEEAARLAAEGGEDIYRRQKARKYMWLRVLSLVIMLFGLGLTALGFVAIDGLIVVLAPTVAIALAGFVGLFAPETLENIGDWFK